MKLVLILASPPLPPPPQDNQQYPPYLEHPLPPPEFIDDGDDIGYRQEEDPYAATGPNFALPDWVPEHYLEKGKNTENCCTEVELFTDTCTVTGFFVPSF